VRGRCRGSGSGRRRAQGQGQRQGQGQGQGQEAGRGSSPSKARRALHPPIWVMQASRYLGSVLRGEVPGAFPRGGVLPPLATVGCKQQLMGCTIVTGCTGQLTRRLTVMGCATLMWE